MAAQGEVPAEGLPIRILLGAATFLVLISPLASAMKGDASTSPRMLLLPIPRGLLHTVQVVSGIGDPVIAVVLPGLLALPLGLAVGGRPAAALAVGAAGLAFFGVLICLAAVAGSLLQMLFRDRRRAEWISMLLITSLVLLGVLPQFFIENGKSAPDVEDSILRVLQPLVSAAPSELYANCLRFSLQGGRIEALASLAALLAMAAMLFGLSWTVCWGGLPGSLTQP